MSLWFQKRNNAEGNPETPALCRRFAFLRQVKCFIEEWVLSGVSVFALEATVGLTDKRYGNVLFGRDL